MFKLQGMMGQEPVEVATGQYNHDANLAEILDEATLGEISSDLRGKYEEDLESSAEWKRLIQRD